MHGQKKKKNLEGLQVVHELIDLFKNRLKCQKKKEEKKVIIHN